MTEQALENLVRRVMLDAARQEYSDLLEEQPEHTFSPTFERKMKRLVHRANHPLRYKILHAAACLLLVLLLTGCAVLAAVPEARQAFAGWIREVYQDVFVYRYNGSKGTRTEGWMHSPEWVPEGYEICDVSSGGKVGLAYIFYLNAEGKAINFLEHTSVETMGLYFNLDEEDVEKQVLVAGRPADLYLDINGTCNVLIWTDDEENLIFTIDGSATEEELIRMAESVRLAPSRTSPHRPAWVPGGYTLSGSTGGWEKLELHYDKESGEQVQFCYWKIGYDIGLEEKLQNALEGLEPQGILVNGLAAELYVDGNGTCHLIWRLETTEENYWISGPVSTEELVRIAESIGQEKTDP